MTFDPTKPVQTRDGQPVTILATGVLEHIPGTDTRARGQTILASIDGGAPRYFSACGAYDPLDGATAFDLINVPEKAEPSGQSEHTPGPWTATPAGAYFAIRAPDPDDESPWEVASVYADCGAEGTDTPANARLIAAAPDLYEALISIATGQHTFGKITRTIERGDMMRIASEALAKARGEA